MASGDTKTESFLRAAAEGSREDLPSEGCCNTKTQNLILGVANRIMDVEDEVERLENNPDVVDIVATYQDLQDYDTSGLTDKDIIRVLEDSTHNNNSTYYRWNSTTSQFDFVGEIVGASVPLAADQGKILNDKITALEARLGGLTLVSISQTDYDALTTKDPNTLYVITGA